MPPGEPDHPPLSRAEIAEAIRGLPEAGWLRLRKIACAYARYCPLEAEDLLQEAFARTIEGTRQCPRHVDLTRFLAEIMRSLASDSVKAQRRQEEARAKCHNPQLVLSVVGEDGDDLMLSSPTPEDEVAGEEQATRIKAATLDLFADDLTAQTIVEGDMEEMEAEEIRALIDLDKVSYASKRRLIRRRIDQAFPDGWTP